MFNKSHVSPFFKPTMKTMYSSFVRSLWRSIGAVVVGVLILALGSITCAYSQAQECIDFDKQENYCSKWQLYYVALCNWTASPPGGHNSPCIFFKDGAGPSGAYNQTDFSGNWLVRAQNGCLCFDYMVQLNYQHSPSPVWQAPKIEIIQGPYSNPTIGARLIGLPSAPNMQDGVWYNVCLPIDSCRNGQLPSNANFTWQIYKKPTGMDDCTAWNFLITNVSGIILLTDYHSTPSESIYFDNFCWRCTPQESQCCRELFAATPTKDTSCCTFQWRLPNSGQACGGIKKILYQVSGGTIDTLVALSPSCVYTTAPPNINNTVSGSFNFGTPCFSPITLYGELNPLTSSGQVKITFTVEFADGSTCRDSLKLGCKPPPVQKCDSLAVSPYIMGDLQLSWRTFKVFNQKMPSSPIKEVKISFTPSPCVTSSAPLGDWNGGGLFVGSSPRSWGVSNSGTPKYSQISMQCPGGPTAPQGPGPVPGSYVKFNLGIDYTCNWQGTVTFTVIHCDGDTCRLSYDWCAKPPGSPCFVSVGPIGIYSVSGLTRKLIVSQAGIQDTNHAIGFIVVRLDSSMIGRARLLSTGVKLTKADAARSIDGIKHIDDNAILATVGDAINDERVPNEYTITPLFECERCDSVPYVIELYDKDANPIDRQVLKAIQTVSSVGSQLIAPGGTMEGVLQIAPNPGDQSVTLRFMALYPGAVSLEIVDALGRQVFTWSDYLDFAGPQEIGMSTERLATGRYQVRLRLPEGTVLTAPLVVVR
jgi:hypothetical protein